jgi:transposase
VELYEAIRRDKAAGESIRSIAEGRGVHRRDVRAALKCAIPPPRKRLERPPPVLTAALRRTIDVWLEADRQAPRKQRHTAHRIFKRLQGEHSYKGAESTVRRYVAERRRALGAVTRAFVPLAHQPGSEGEVDWYEAAVDFPWGRETVQLFQMRACHSGREFHMAFPRQTQQAFLEAHAAAFAYFGGVFQSVRYDNLKSAARKVLRGRNRLESDRFVAMRSHYLYASEFCLPGVEGAHEKGGVEGAVGRFRRNHLVPVPACESYDVLNRLLLDACAEDDGRNVAHRPTTVAEDWEAERARLQPLPATAFDSAETMEARVDDHGRVSVGTNHYSAPIRLTQRTVEVRQSAQRVEIRHDGQLVAAHERLQGRHGERLVLDHYLELLWHKPGALGRSRPLAAARAEGRWPATYDTLWTRMRERYGDAEGTRQLLTVLMLHRETDADLIHTAVGLALEHGCHDAGAVAVLLRQLREPARQSTPLPDLGALARFSRPMSTVKDYDALLGRRPKQMEVH